MNEGLRLLRLLNFLLCFCVHIKKAARKQEKKAQTERKKWKEVKRWKNINSKTISLRRLQTKNIIHDYYPGSVLKKPQQRIRQRATDVDSRQQGFVQPWFAKHRISSWQSYGNSFPESNRAKNKSGSSTPGRHRTTPDILLLLSYITHSNLFPPPFFSLFFLSLCFVIWSSSGIIFFSSPHTLLLLPNLFLFFMARTLILSYFGAFFSTLFFVLTL